MPTRSGAHLQPCSDRTATEPRPTPIGWRDAGRAGGVYYPVHVSESPNAQAGVRPEAAAAADADSPQHRYNAELAGRIEADWQQVWTDRGTFNVPNPVGSLAPTDGSSVPARACRRPRADPFLVLRDGCRARLHGSARAYRPAVANPPESLRLLHTPPRFR